MESEQFDRLVRGAAGASRRGVLRAGIGAVAATALVAIGVGPTGTDARRRRRKRLVCLNGQTLQVGNRKRFLRRGATKGACEPPSPPPPPATCPANRPVTCGDGCCPTEYSLCCEETTSSTDTHSCNPPASNCCPASQGGGSCPAEFFGIGLFPTATVCCPATEQTPRGWCGEEGGDCCTTEEGGFSCPPGGECCPIPIGGSCGCEDFGPWCAFAEAGEICCTAAGGGGSCFVDVPVCCPENDNFPATCCPEGSTCCSADEDCGGGSCNGGCCDAVGQIKPGHPGGSAPRSRSRRSGVERFHMAAR